VPTERQKFRELLTSGRFLYGAELVTTRGFAPPEQAGKIVELGNALTSDPRIDWVSITDNPGGNVMLPPDWLAQLLRQKGAHIVIHLTCKDRNRNALETAAWRFASEGFDSVLAMTGDYPKAGYGGLATPVFDLDSVSLIALLKAMNDGLPVPGRKGEMTQLAKTDFYIGCAVSPFKREENELMPQYFKLLRKLSNGAHFVYSQLGYDMRKFHEIKLVLAANGYATTPVIGNVYVLNKTVAGLFHRREVPGCVVSKKLFDLANKYAGGPDKGKSFFFELAAKQLAVFKGLGFAGGYLGGVAKADSFFEIIEKSKSYGANDWKQFAKELQYPQENEFYLFEQDPATGLGNPNQINRQYLASLKTPVETPNVTLGYRFSRLLHDKVFKPGTVGYRLMQRMYAGWDKQPAGKLPNTAHKLEHMSKFVFFGCKDCGDCSLPDTGYLCPLVSCSKGARNGPCGGSSEGQCEMLDKQCIWARAYDRLKYYGESEQLVKGPAVFYNAQLKGTSAWANTFLGRDHQKNPTPTPTDSTKKAS
jgi:methylenetetrahydrofolate reductase (NADPH)